MATISTPVEAPKYDDEESWKNEVNKPARDNRYQTEDVTLTKGRIRGLSCARAVHPRARAGATKDTGARQKQQHLARRAV